MPLHDILPPIEIIDHSFLYILGVILGVVALIVYFYKKRKKQTLSPFQILEAFNFKDAKKIAFQFSYYGKKLFKDERLKVRFLELKERLEPYKYSEKSIQLPTKLEDEVKELLEQIREDHV